MHPSVLQDFCDAFLDGGYPDFWETAEGADGECFVASKEFLKFLDRYGENARIIMFTDEAEASVPHIEKYFSVKVYPYQRVPHRWYQNGCRWAGHFVVRVGDLCVDWTARQFNPEAPFPLIFEFGG